MKQQSGSVVLIQYSVVYNYIHAVYTAMFDANHTTCALCFLQRAKCVAVFILSVTQCSLFSVQIVLHATASQVAMSCCTGGSVHHLYFSVCKARG